MGSNTRLNIERLYEKAIKCASFAGHKEIAEDFAGWISVRWLEGRSQHQTLGQSLIDYLRIEYGGVGKHCGSDALLRSHRSSQTPNEECDETTEEFLDRLSARDRSLERFNNGDSEFKSFNLPSRGLLKGRENEIYEMLINEDFTFAEIADKFRITESRVSQIMKIIKQKLFNTVGIKLYQERIEMGETEFDIEWISF